MGEWRLMADGLNRSAAGQPAGLFAGDKSFRFAKPLSRNGAGMGMRLRGELTELLPEE
jgi:hypothetical protein